MKLTFAVATDADAAAIAVMRLAAGERLTQAYGHGHWSSAVSERGVLRGIATSRVWVARSRGRIVGSLRLATKKPWAIDPTYFTPVKKAIYLLDMAVAPALQGRGIGRSLCERAVEAVQAWPAHSIRLDAYDSAAGAGGFYSKCGFREVGRVVYRGVPLVYFERLVLADLK